jgi:hypothetical protein
MAFLPLPKNYHPDFARPGVKPSGPVEIDWSNPLTRGLRAAYIYSSGRVVDVTRNTVLSTNGTPDVLADEKGQHLGFNGVDEYLIGDSEEHTKIGNAPLTLVVGAVATSSPSTLGESLISRGRHGSGGKRYDLAVTNTLVIAQIDDDTSKSQINLAYAIQLGRFYQYSLVRGGGDLSVYMESDVNYVSGSVADTTGNIGDFNGESLTIAAAHNSGGTISNQFGGNIYYAYVFADGKSEGELRDLYRDPYQILKPVEPMFYFTAAGGTVVDVTVGMGLSVGQTSSGQATANGSITLAQEVGVSDSGQATANGSITLAQEVGVSDSGQGTANGISNLAMQLALSNNAIATVDTDVTLSNQMGYSSSGQANAQVSLPLDLSLEQSVSAIAQAVAQVTFSQNNGYTVSTAGLTVDVSTSMGIGLSMTPVIKVTMNGSITLSSELAQEVSANANTYGTCDLGFQVALQVAAKALAEASITISAVTSVTTTASSIIIGIVTPDERSYAIEVDNRDFLILAENRDYEVK